MQLAEEVRRAKAIVNMFPLLILLLIPIQVSTFGHKQPTNETANSVEKATLVGDNCTNECDYHVASYNSKQNEDEKAAPLQNSASIKSLEFRTPPIEAELVVEPIVAPANLPAKSKNRRLELKRPNVNRFSNNSTRTLRYNHQIALDEDSSGRAQADNNNNNNKNLLNILMANNSAGEQSAGSAGWAPIVPLPSTQENSRLAAALTGAAVRLSTRPREFFQLNNNNNSHKQSVLFNLTNGLRQLATAAETENSTRGSQEQLEPTRQRRFSTMRRGPSGLGTNHLDNSDLFLASAHSPQIDLASPKDRTLLLAHLLNNQQLNQATQPTTAALAPNLFQQQQDSEQVVKALLNTMQNADVQPTNVPSAQLGTFLAQDPQLITAVGQQQLVKQANGQLFQSSGHSNLDQIAGAQLDDIGEGDGSSTITYHLMPKGGIVGANSNQQTPEGTSALRVAGLGGSSDGESALNFNQDQLLNALQAGISTANLFATQSSNDQPDEFSAQQMIQPNADALASLLENMFKSALDSKSVHRPQLNQQSSSSSSSSLSPSPPPLSSPQQVAQQFQPTKNEQIGTLQIGQQPNYPPQSSTSHLALGQSPHLQVPPSNPYPVQPNVQNSNFLPPHSNYSTGTHSTIPQPLSQVLQHQSHSVANYDPLQSGASRYSEQTSFDPLLFHYPNGNPQQGYNPSSGPRGTRRNKKRPKASASQKSPVVKVQKRPRVSHNGQTFYDTPNELQPSATFHKWKYPWLYRPPWDEDDDEEEGETEINLRFFNNFSRMGPLGGVARMAAPATLIVSLAFLILSNVSLAATVIVHGVSSVLRSLSQNQSSFSSPVKAQQSTSRLAKIIKNFDSTDNTTAFPRVTQPGNMTLALFNSTRGELGKKKAEFKQSETQLDKRIRSFSKMFDWLQM